MPINIYFFAAIPGPVEFQYARDSILTGAIDFNPPEPYGYPQPLTEEVLLGQEMYVEFTEDLDCRTPFSFDIEMTIAGPSESPSSSPSATPQTPSHDSTSDASFDRSLSQNTDFVLRNGDGLHVICEERRIKLKLLYVPHFCLSLLFLSPFSSFSVYLSVSLLLSLALSFSLSFSVSLFISL